MLPVEIPMLTHCPKTEGGSIRIVPLIGISQLTITAKENFPSPQA